MWGVFLFKVFAILMEAICLPVSFCRRCRKSCIRLNEGGRVKLVFHFLSCVCFVSFASFFGGSSSALPSGCSPSLLLVRRLFIAFPEIKDPTSAPLVLLPSCGFPSFLHLLSFTCPSSSANPSPDLAETAAPAEPLAAGFFPLFIILLPPIFSSSSSSTSSFLFRPPACPLPQARLRPPPFQTTFLIPPRTSALTHLGISSGSHLLLHPSSLSSFPPPSLPRSASIHSAARPKEAT